MTSPQAQSAAADAAGRHEPVLLQRCLDLLAPAIEGAARSTAARPVMIDCTLGLGGHTEAALERFPTLKVVGIDRDPEAIALASARLERFGDRFIAVRDTYDAVNRVAREHSASSDGVVDAVLMDLGVSSLQLDEASRGFSYARPAPLDMRMDQGSGPTAQDLLEGSSAAELTHILRTYGEERFASRIAAAVVNRRQVGEPVSSTQELAELVRQAVPAPARRSGGHPAKRTFQALRIAVNAELDVLELAVPRALNSLRVGGRLVVESYQSLEDRIVKRALAHGATSRAPQDLPVVPEADRPYLELLTSGAEKADARELEHNPRSAPVRLRAAERLRPTDRAPAPQTRPSSSDGRVSGRRAGRRANRHRTT